MAQQRHFWNAREETWGASIHFENSLNNGSDCGEIQPDSPVSIVAANVTATLIDQVNSVASSISASAIAIVIAYMIALCVGAGAQSWINYRLTQRIDAVLGEQFFLKLARLPFAFFQSRSTGDLLARMTSNTVMRDVLAGRMVGSLIDLAFIFVFLIYLGLAAPPVSRRRRRDRVGRGHGRCCCPPPAPGGQSTRGGR